MNDASRRGAGWQTLADLWGGLRPWRRAVALVLALLVLARLAAVGLPVALRSIVDEIAPGGASPAVAVPIWLLVVYAGLRYAIELLTEMRNLAFSRVGQHVVSSFSEHALGQLLHTSPRFSAQRSMGDLADEVERGVGGVGTLMKAGVFTVLPTAVEFAAVLLIVTAAHGLKFGFAIAATMIGWAAWTRWKSPHLTPPTESHAHGLLMDTLRNLDAVKAHGREAGERARYQEALAQDARSNVNHQKTLSALHLGQAGIVALGVGAVMLMAGLDTASGRMSLGGLVMVNAYLMLVFLPLPALGAAFREARNALPDTARLLSLLHRPSDPHDPDAKPLRGGDTTLRFEHVDFGYEPQRRVLHDFSLEIPHGKTCAVVGGSGLGKSTLARLLMRWAEPDAGRITIGGQSVAGLTPQSLREAIGVVPQDPTLFEDTVAYNIGYGRPGALREEIVAAARAAQADDFIRLLPYGYETRVGERGARLSGCEKQRIAIARAFLKNPPIMVLDEATSALDAKAERAIQGALGRMARDRTSLIIAHRLSTIVNADQIIVMDGGRIVERGRHETLLAQGGLYFQLWELQRQQQQAQTLERRLLQHPVNLAGLLALTLDSLRGELTATHTEPVTDIDPSVANVVGDAGCLARIVHLACQLALHGAVGGRLAVKLARVSKGCQLTIGFHGRLEAGAAAPDTLELRALVGEAGGDLAIERDATGGLQQYRLEFALPAVVPQKPAWPESEPVMLEDDDTEPLITDPHPLAGLTVLCVDDDEDALASLVSLLEIDGARTERVTSGRAALEHLARREVADWPDMLVCDIALGAEDGHAVVRSVRAMEARRGVPAAQSLPAVALTGMAQPEDRQRALTAGFHRHLAKPVRPDELVRTLRQLARAHA